MLNRILITYHQLFLMAVLKGQLFSKCIFCVFNFFQKRMKTSRPEVSLYSKVEFIRSFFGRIHGLTICFRVLLTFSIWIIWGSLRFGGNVWDNISFFNFLLTQRSLGLKLLQSYFTIIHCFIDWPLIQRVKHCNFHKWAFPSQNAYDLCG